MNSKNDKCHMDIVAVVPTINRPNELLKCAKHIKDQTVTPDVLVIVDQSDYQITRRSIDELKEKFKDTDINIIHIHDHSLSGLTAARQRVVNEIRANIYFFIDDDVFIKRNFIKEIVLALKKNPEYGGLAGIDENAVIKNWFKTLPYRWLRIGPFSEPRRYIAANAIGDKAVLNVNVISGGMTAYRAKVFEEFSFDHNLVGYCLGEDVDFSYRVSKKWKIGIVPSAQSEHIYSQTERYDPFDMFESRIASACYLYRKNFKGERLARVGLCLYLITILFQAVKFSLVNRNLVPVRGCFSGLKKVRDGFQGIKFIRSAPGTN